MLVTHDALDAIALADRVVILEAGQVTQAGTIDEVTTRPRSPYVADLIGVNLLRGHGPRARRSTWHRALRRGDRRRSDSRATVLLLIHPHAVGLHRQSPRGQRPQPVAEGRITGFDMLGDRVRVRLAGDVPLVAEVTPAAVAEMGLVEGESVWATVKATEITAYPR